MILVAGRQFVTGTASDSLPQQQSPAVTTTASHLEIMKLPKKRGRPPKGPDDFSPPLPPIPTHTSTAATSVSCKFTIMYLDPSYGSKNFEYSSQFLILCILVVKLGSLNKHGLLTLRRTATN